MSTNTVKDLCVNNLDITEDESATKQGRDLSRINDSFESDENKENLNVTNFFKLEDTLEVNINSSVEKPFNLIYTNSPLNCKKNTNDVLDSTIEKIDSLNNFENIAVFDEQNMNSQSAIEAGVLWDNIELLSGIPIQYSNEKPRESLLTTFDPLYKTDLDINSFCKNLIGNIVDKILFLEEIENFADISIESEETFVNMADISDKSRFEDKDISILEYPSDINDKEKITLLEEQMSDVKLRLNASQQIRINLELQLRQKEEVLIKIQAEFSRKEQAYQKEIKQLKENAENKSVENAESQLKELQDMVRDFKSQEAKLISEISLRRTDELEYQKIMEKYEKEMSVQVTQLKKFMEDHETVKCHLANLELAFSDLHQKYERAKKIIEGYKSNEDILKQNISEALENERKCDEKYETLKAHAKTQIEKSNLEIQAVREHYDAEIMKLNAIVRRLEIKTNSLTESLDQKTKECTALSALCDEVTGQSKSP